MCIFQYQSSLLELTHLILGEFVVQIIAINHFK